MYEMQGPRSATRYLASRLLGCGRPGGPTTGGWTPVRSTGFPAPQPFRSCLRIGARLQW
jgi:hypothetical protein